MDFRLLLFGILLILFVREVEAGGKSRFSVGEGFCMDLRSGGNLAVKDLDRKLDFVGVYAVPCLVPLLGEEEKIRVSHGKNIFNITLSELSNFLLYSIKVDLENKGVVEVESYEQLFLRQYSCFPCEEDKEDYIRFFKPFIFQKINLEESLGVSFDRFDEYRSLLGEK
ncbi:hypothetical protein ACJJIQ_06660 [Microbulbifer sp. ANSA003]|uniref:hypothetical protein n=1 Tax=Microbulbifer sp. ANSA003 TaxID=3243360 RepID=UPI0040423926